ncbi:BadF/BadG/BcrA/BcrD ATPase family protein [Leifsonia kafniensis]|uniref:BadF/BadG/BcrA/BcrD ATPase family protein n=1 Tax=Leifsonia kafniensis TaxID=475957 RepID=A0ABP7KWU5_9MICO
MVSALNDPLVLCIDLGKTSSRAVLADSLGVRHSATLDGVAAAADQGVAATARILATIALLPPEPLLGATACGVGAAGTLTDPSVARTIASAIHTSLGLPVAVTSDILTAHLGAFAGAPGVTLVAGTGAVAVGLDDHGELHRVDGWGPDIGDLGSGSWLGREGMRAVLGAASGLRPPTSLGDQLAALTEGDDPVRWVAEADNRAQQLARFAPAILGEAQLGDAVSRDIVDEAIALLRATALAAAVGTQTATALGGLTRHPWFAARLFAQLAAAGLTITTPAGDALSGARLAALRSDLPHERHIHRA